MYKDKKNNDQNKNKFKKSLTLFLQQKKIENTQKQNSQIEINIQP